MYICLPRILRRNSSKPLPVIHGIVVTTVRKCKRRKVLPRPFLSLILYTAPVRTSTFSLTASPRHLYKWAMTILGSRAFSSSQLSYVNLPSGSPLLSKHNPDMLLYPGLDMLNHSPSTLNNWKHDAEGFSIVMKDESGPSVELWNPYGGKSNGECPCHPQPIQSLRCKSQTDTDVNQYYSPSAFVSRTTLMTLLR